MNPLKIVKKIHNFNSNLLNIKKFILDERISLDECRAIIREGMARREENFLLAVRDQIYADNKSPYLKLLELSRIGYEDIKKMVSRQGIEDTLRTLKEDGIYVTYEEFKGNRAVRRRGGTFNCKQSDFYNPLQKGLGEVYSGTSLGAATNIYWTSGYITQKAIHLAAALEMHRCFDAPLALWLPTLPAQIGLAPFIFQKIGLVPKIRFSQVQRTLIEPLILKSLCRLDKIIGRNGVIYKEVPFRYIPLNDAHIIAEWAAKTIRDSSACSIRTFVSSAVRICVAAKERNLDIKNTTFIVSSEPLTERRRKEIEQCGCRLIHTYSATETGFIGCSCHASGGEADDVHLFRDSFAVIQRPRWVESVGRDVGSFLFTSLYPGCPFVMLNMELGDYGSIEKRRCGCLFESYGLDEHLYGIRSHEKITAEGMNSNISDILRVIEEVFPEEFGGASVDYQLVEEEKDHGLRRLVVYVSPQVGLPDKKRMKNILFRNISPNVKRDMRIKIWEQVNALEIRQDYPITTIRGKTPLYFYKNK